MTPLLTPLALFYLIACLLLIDGTSAWHTEIRDHDILAFGHSRRAPVATNRGESTTTNTTNRRKQVDADNIHGESQSQSQSRSWHILHSTRSSHDSDYSHTVDNVSRKSTPRRSKQQDTRTPVGVRGRDNHHNDNTAAEEENDLDLSAATDMTACISDFGCF
jgi:hypothetical protein